MSHSTEKATGGDQGTCPNAGHSLDITVLSQTLPTEEHAGLGTGLTCHRLQRELGYLNAYSSRQLALSNRLKKKKYRSLVTFLKHEKDHLPGMLISPH